MPKVYLIRHAETAHNVMAMQTESGGVIGGRSPWIDITPNGKKQALRLGKYLATRGISPDYVLRSPTNRTEQTARFCYLGLGIDTPEEVVTDELHEMSQGEWEGRPRSIYDTDRVIADITRQGMDFAAPGGESANQTADRLLACLGRRVLHEYDKNYFVFTHGMAISCLTSRILGIDSQPQTLANILPNASYTLIMPEGSSSWQIGETVRSLDSDSL